MTTYVLARHLVARAMRNASAWGIAFAVVVVSSAVGYASLYKTPLQREAVQATLGSNAGLAALFGPMRDISHVGGFTAWRSLGVLTLVGAIWGLLAGTRMVRGEEESGRWENVLATPLTRARATVAVVCAGVSAIVVLFAFAELGVLAADSSSNVSIAFRPGLYTAFVLVVPATLYLFVGMLCAQLAATRSQANVIAGGLFGASYLIRVVAASGSGAALRHVSPLSWIDDSAPMTGSHVVWLLPPVALAVMCAVGSVLLAGRRDLGGSFVRERVPRTRTWLLNGTPQLAARLSRGTALGWSIAVVATCGVVGLVAKSVASTNAPGGAMHEMLAKLGSTRSDAAGFLGLAMITVSTMVALAAAGYVAATRDEEGNGYLDNVLARAVRRTPWLLGRVAVASLVVLVMGTLAGVAMWASSGSSHAGLSVATLLAAGVNVVPMALLVLGIGMFVFSIAPRLSAVVAYGIVAWSFLVEMVGSLVNAPRWLLDLSLLHHVALAPGADPRWSTNAVMLAMAVVAIGASVVLFGRRDLSTA
jgi:ABC-2 type transport system permease protein